MTEKSFRVLLSALADRQVEFILIGGLAGIAHGAARATLDVDVVYARSPENVQRMCDALAPFEPYLRGAPRGLPFKFDAETVKRGLNFTLETNNGDIDLLGEVSGGGSYQELLPFTEIVQLFGLALRCVNLGTLIQLKRSAGRPKDREALAELVALFEDIQSRNKKPSSNRDG